MAMPFFLGGLSSYKTFKFRKAKAPRQVNDGGL